MKMYDEGNKLGIAITSGFVETHAGDLHVYADRTQAGNIVFITTDNFKNYIPIEWISEYAKRFDNDRGHSVQVTMDYAVESMLAEWDWEKENGIQ